jgi:glycosyltransferase involved in cell wall biosynthesis
MSPKAEVVKLVLAHPGVGPFVQQTARALLEAGLLANYWTTFADQPNARWRRALVRIGSAMDMSIEQELLRRAVSEVPPALLRLSPAWEIVRTLLTKVGTDPRLVDAVWEREILRFDRGVAKNGLDGVGGIYGYEYSALATFQEAKERGLARIYEVPSPAHDFVQNLIQRELDQYPELDDGTRAYFLARQARRTERVRCEWELANVVIANSNFTRDSYAASGLDVGKVRVIPLGAPPVSADGGEGGSMEHEPLRVLWAGTFSVRKGAHHLLSAWSKLAPGKNAVLRIFGQNDLPRELTNDLPASIKLSASIPHAALFNQYRAADVLVFPTLCDGFGLVVMEAFAHGLPVITTTRAGAADLVRHGDNGFIIPAGKAEELAAALDWCLTHRKELKAMRSAALETAERWQWHDFRQALTGNVIDALRDVGYAQ